VAEDAARAYDQKLVELHGVSGEQHDMQAQHDTAWHSIALHSMAQHMCCTAWHSMALCAHHSTAQHGPTGAGIGLHPAAWHGLMPRRG
jgi:hypothetical protein